MNVKSLTSKQIVFVSKNAYICDMEKRFEKYRGIHPGIILERELRKRNLAQRSFALSVGLARQSFNQIIKGKRSLPLPAALKIDRELNIEEGTLALLQTYYEIEKEKRKLLQENRPNMELLRKSLFWDTDSETIDWTRQARAVILRVFERGNLTEKKEILRFYGPEKIRQVLRDNNNAAGAVQWNKAV